MIKRKIQKNIENNLFKGKVVIIYGARQVGKTTLVKEIMKKYSPAVYLNCDEPDIKKALTEKTSTELKNFLGKNKLVVIDEAQRVKNIGLILKLIVDNMTDLQVIAIGSSSFDLSNEVNEPLTGRKYEYFLSPFSFEELKQNYSDLELKRLLETRMIYGAYPEVINNPAEADQNLINLTRSYLYKDVLQYQRIKNPDVLEKLLQALALQVGSEVSYNELASLVGIDKKTIESYLRILEQSFIIFRLCPFSRNIRNELKKMRKIYFYDNGLRNALINNLNPLQLRQDVGALWENLMISERLKFNGNNNLTKNIYFWRTQSRQEIDYLEEAGDKLAAYEFKWKKDKTKTPTEFLKAYKDSSFQVINQDNFLNFVL